MSDKLSFDELAALTGIGKPTIRNYIQQNLLRGAAVQGRGAFYTTHHLARLRAIKYWKEAEGKSLEQIRAMVLALPEQEIEAVAARAAEEARQTPAPLVTGSPSARAALEFLQTPRAARAAGTSPVEPPSPVEPQPKGGPLKQPSLTAIDRLLLAIEKLNAGRPIPRRAKGEAWVNIPITHDIELHVRGISSADQLARLERIADHLREFLIGA